MTAESITSLAALATALITLMTVVITLAVSIRSKKRIETVKETTDEIHVLANDRLTTVIDRVEQLSTTLRSANVAVPEMPEPDNEKR